MKTTTTTILQLSGLSARVAYGHLFPNVTYQVTSQPQVGYACHISVELLPMSL